MNGWKKALEINPDAAAALLLRLALGMLFFFAGLGKFLGEGGPMGFAQWILGEFEATYLPTVLVIPYAYTLPYIEVIIGAVLLLGLFTRQALLATGLLLISLAFGKVLQHDYATVANNLNYVFMAAVGLWLASRDNRYSLDGLLKKFRDRDA